MATASPISVGHDTVSVTSGSTVGLTAANIPDNTNSAEVYTPYEIHYWLDGTSPTTTTGLVWPAGTTFLLESRSEILNFKAIATSTTSALAVNYRDV
jgi:hypothetical protein